MGAHRSPSPIPVTASPSPPHPASYLGAVLQPTGRTPLSLSSTAKEPPSLPHLWATTAQAAMKPPPMARQSRPRRRPGCRHRPRGPNQSDGAIPSLPKPLLLGGTLQPTSTSTMSAKEATVICRSLSPNTVPISPSTRPFTIHRTGDIVPSGGRNDSFRGSIHDGSHMPVVFVGVMALVPLVLWGHSVDTDIGLGPPVYPRPFSGGGIFHI